MAGQERYCACKTAKCPVPSPAMCSRFRNACNPACSHVYDHLYGLKRHSCARNQSTKGTSSRRSLSLPPRNDPYAHENNIYSNRPRSVEPPKLPQPVKQTNPGLEFVTNVRRKQEIPTEPTKKDTSTRRARRDSTDNTALLTITPISPRKPAPVAPKVRAQTQSKSPGAKPGRGSKASESSRTSSTIPTQTRSFKRTLTPTKTAVLTSTQTSKDVFSSNQTPSFMQPKTAPPPITQASPQVKSASANKKEPYGSANKSPRQDFPPSTVNDQEYLHFLLRITEDILRNNNYTAQAMQKVFDNHVAANRRRLDEKKMREQIENLKKELQGSQNPVACNDETTSMCMCHAEKQKFTDKIPKCELCPATMNPPKPCNCEDASCPAKEMPKKCPTTAPPCPSKNAENSAASGKTAAKRPPTQKSPAPSKPPTEKSPTPSKPPTPAHDPATPNPHPPSNLPSRPKNKKKQAPSPKRAKTPVTNEGPKGTKTCTKRPVPREPDTISELSVSNDSSVVILVRKPFGPSSEVINNDADVSNNAEVLYDTKSAGADQSPRISFSSEMAEENTCTNATNCHTASNNPSTNKAKSVSMSVAPEERVTTTVYYNPRVEEKCFCSTPLRKTALKVTLSGTDEGEEYVLVEGPVALPKVVYETKTIQIMVENASSTLLDAEMHSGQSTPNMSTVNLYQPSGVPRQIPNGVGSISYYVSNATGAHNARGPTSVSFVADRQINFTDYDLTPEREVRAETEDKMTQSELKKSKPGSKKVEVEKNNSGSSGGTQSGESGGRVTSAGTSRENEALEYVRAGETYRGETGRRGSAGSPVDTSGISDFARRESPPRTDEEPRRKSLTREDSPSKDERKTCSHTGAVGGKKECKGSCTAAKAKELEAHQKCTKEECRVKLTAGKCGHSVPCPVKQAKQAAAEAQSCAKAPATSGVSARAGLEKESGSAKGSATKADKVSKGRVTDAQSTPMFARGAAAAPSDTTRKIESSKSTPAAVSLPSGDEKVVPAKDAAPVDKPAETEKSDETVVKDDVRRPTRDAAMEWRQVEPTQLQVPQKKPGYSWKTNNLKRTEGITSTPVFSQTSGLVSEVPERETESGEKRPSESSSSKREAGKFESVVVKPETTTKSLGPKMAPLPRAQKPTSVSGEAKLPAPSREVKQPQTVVVPEEKPVKLKPSGPSAVTPSKSAPSSSLPKTGVVTKVAASPVKDRQLTAATGTKSTPSSAVAATIPKSVKKKLKPSTQAASPAVPGIKPPSAQVSPMATTTTIQKTVEKQLKPSPQAFSPAVPGIKPPPAQVLLIAAAATPPKTVDKHLQPSATTQGETIAKSQIVPLQKAGTMVATPTDKSGAVVTSKVKEDYLRSPSPPKARKRRNSAPAALMRRKRKPDTAVTSDAPGVSKAVTAGTSLGLVTSTPIAKPKLAGKPEPNLEAQPKAVSGGTATGTEVVQEAAITGKRLKRSKPKKIARETKGATAGGPTPSTATPKFPETKTPTAGKPDLSSAGTPKTISDGGQIGIPHEAKATTAAGKPELSSAVTPKTVAGKPKVMSTAKASAHETKAGKPELSSAVTPKTITDGGQIGIPHEAKATTAAGKPELSSAVTPKTVAGKPEVTSTAKASAHETKAGKPALSSAVTPKTITDGGQIGIPHEAKATTAAGKPDVSLAATPKAMAHETKAVKAGKPELSSAVTPKTVAGKPEVMSTAKASAHETKAGKPELSSAVTPKTITDGGQIGISHEAKATTAAGKPEVSLAATPKAIAHETKAAKAGKPELSTAVTPKIITDGGQIGIPHETKASTAAGKPKVSSSVTPKAIAHETKAAVTPKILDHEGEIGKQLKTKQATGGKSEVTSAVTPKAIAHEGEIGIPHETKPVISGKPEVTSTPKTTSHEIKAATAGKSKSTSAVTEKTIAAKGALAGKLELTSTATPKTIAHETKAKYGKPEVTSAVTPKTIAHGGQIGIPHETKPVISGKPEVTATPKPAHEDKAAAAGKAELTSTDTPKTVAHETKATIAGKPEAASAKILDRESKAATVQSAHETRSPITDKREDAAPVATAKSFTPSTAIGAAAAVHGPKPQSIQTAGTATASVKDHDAKPAIAGIADVTPAGAVKIVALGSTIRAAQSHDRKTVAATSKVTPAGKVVAPGSAVDAANVPDQEAKPEVAGPAELASTVASETIAHEGPTGKPLETRPAIGGKPDEKSTATAKTFADKPELSKAVTAKAIVHEPKTAATGKAELASAGKSEVTSTPIIKTIAHETKAAAPAKSELTSAVTPKTIAHETKSTKAGKPELSSAVTPKTTAHEGQMKIPHETRPAIVGKPEIISSATPKTFVHETTAITPEKTALSAAVTPKTIAHGGEIGIPLKTQALAGKPEVTPTVTPKAIAHETQATTYSKPAVTPAIALGGQMVIPHETKQAIARKPGVTTTATPKTKTEAHETKAATTGKPEISSAVTPKTIAHGGQIGIPHETKPVVSGVTPKAIAHETKATPYSKPSVTPAIAHGGQMVIPHETKQAIAGKPGVTTTATPKTKTEAHETKAATTGKPEISSAVTPKTIAHGRQTGVPHETKPVVSGKPELKSTSITKTPDRETKAATVQSAHETRTAMTVTPSIATAKSFTPSTAIAKPETIQSTGTSVTPVKDHDAKPEIAGISDVTPTDAVKIVALGSTIRAAASHDRNALAATSKVTPAKKAAKDVAPESAVDAANVQVQDAKPEVAGKPEVIKPIATAKISTPSTVIGTAATVHDAKPEVAGKLEVTKPTALVRDVTSKTGATVHEAKPAIVGKLGGTPFTTAASSAAPSAGIRGAVPVHETKSPVTDRPQVIPPTTAAKTVIPSTTVGAASTIHPAKLADTGKPEVTQPSASVKEVVPSSAIEAKAALHEAKPSVKSTPEVASTAATKTTAQSTVIAATVHEAEPSVTGRPEVTQPTAVTKDAKTAVTDKSGVTRSTVAAASGQETKSAVTGRQQVMPPTTAAKTIVPSTTVGAASTIHPAKLAVTGKPDVTQPSASAKAVVPSATIEAKSALHEAKPSVTSRPEVASTAATKTTAQSTAIAAAVHEAKPSITGRPEGTQPTAAVKDAKSAATDKPGVTKPTVAAASVHEAKPEIVLSIGTAPVKDHDAKPTIAGIPDVTPAEAVKIVALGSTMREAASHDRHALPLTTSKVMPTKPVAKGVASESAVDAAVTSKPGVTPVTVDANAAVGVKPEALPIATTKTVTPSMAITAEAAVFEEKPVVAGKPELKPPTAAAKTVAPSKAIGASATVHDVKWAVSGKPEVAQPIAVAPSTSIGVAKPEVSSKPGVTPIAVAKTVTPSGGIGAVAAIHEAKPQVVGKPEVKHPVAVEKAVAPSTAIGVHAAKPEIATKPEVTPSPATTKTVVPSTSGAKAIGAHDAKPGVTSGPGVTPPTATAKAVTPSAGIVTAGTVHEAKPTAVGKPEVTKPPAIPKAVTPSAGVTGKTETIPPSAASRAIEQSALIGVATTVQGAKPAVTGRPEVTEPTGAVKTVKPSTEKDAAATIHEAKPEVVGKPEVTQSIPVAKTVAAIGAATAVQVAKPAVAGKPQAAQPTVAAKQVAPSTAIQAADAVHEAKPAVAGKPDVPPTTLATKADAPSTALAKTTALPEEKPVVAGKPELKPPTAAAKTVAPIATIGAVLAVPAAKPATVGKPEVTPPISAAKAVAPTVQIGAAVVVHEEKPVVAGKPELKPPTAAAKAVAPSTTIGAAATLPEAKPAAIAKPQVTAPIPAAKIVAPSTTIGAAAAIQEPKPIVTGKPEATPTTAATKTVVPSTAIVGAAAVQEAKPTAPGKPEVTALPETAKPVTPSTTIGAATAVQEPQRIVIGRPEVTPSTAVTKTVVPTTAIGAAATIDAAKPAIAVKPEATSTVSAKQVAPMTPIGAAVAVQEAKPAVIAKPQPITAAKPAVPSAVGAADSMHGAKPAIAGKPDVTSTVTAKPVGPKAPIGAAAVQDAKPAAIAKPQATAPSVVAKTSVPSAIGAADSVHAAKPVVKGKPEVTQPTAAAKQVTPMVPIGGAADVQEAKPVVAGKPQVTTPTAAAKAVAPSAAIGAAGSVHATKPVVTGKPEIPKPTPTAKAPSTISAAATSKPVIGPTHSIGKGVTPAAAIGATPAIHEAKAPIATKPEVLAPKTPTGAATSVDTTAKTAKSEVKPAVTLTPKTVTVGPGAMAAAAAVAAIGITTGAAVLTPRATSSARSTAKPTLDIPQRIADKDDTKLGETETDAAILRGKPSGKPEGTATKPAEIPKTAAVPATASKPGVPPIRSLPKIEPATVKPAKKVVAAESVPGFVKPAVGVAAAVAPAATKPKPEEVILSPTEAAPLTAKPAAKAESIPETSKIDGSKSPALSEGSTLPPGTKLAAAEFVLVLKPPSKSDPSAEAAKKPPKPHEQLSAVEKTEAVGLKTPPVLIIHGTGKAITKPEEFVPKPSHLDAENLLKSETLDDEYPSVAPKKVSGTEDTVSLDRIKRPSIVTAPRSASYMPPPVRFEPGQLEVVSTAFIAPEAAVRPKETRKRLSKSQAELIKDLEELSLLTTTAQSSMSEIKTEERDQAAEAAALPILAATAAPIIAAATFLVSPPGSETESPAALASPPASMEESNAARKMSHGLHTPKREKDGQEEGPLLWPGLLTALEGTVDDADSVTSETDSTGSAKYHHLMRDAWTSMEEDDLPGAVYLQPTVAATEVAAGAAIGAAAGVAVGAAAGAAAGIAVAPSPQPLRFEEQPMVATTAPPPLAAPVAPAVLAGEHYNLLEKPASQKETLVKSYSPLATNREDRRPFEYSLLNTTSMGQMEERAQRTHDLDMDSSLMTDADDEISLGIISGSSIDEPEELVSSPSAVSELMSIRSESSPPPGSPRRSKDVDVSDLTHAQILAKLDSVSSLGSGNARDADRTVKSVTERLNEFRNIDREGSSKQLQYGTHMSTMEIRKRGDLDELKLEEVKPKEDQEKTKSGCFRFLRKDAKTNGTGETGK